MRESVLRQACCISSGTLATLITEAGIPYPADQPGQSYAMLDQVWLGLWFPWLEEHHARFQKWQEAWAAFLAERSLPERLAIS